MQEFGRILRRIAELASRPAVTVIELGELPADIAIAPPLAFEHASQLEQSRVTLRLQQSTASMHAIYPVQARRVCRETACHM